MTTCTATPARPAPRSFLSRLVELLAATDNFVTWYGAHRAWPANEPPRIEPGR